MLKRAFVMLLGMSLLSGQAAVADASITYLHSFTGIPDGANPVAGLVSDKTGALYGVTSQGGAYGQGTVFKLTPPTTMGGPWSETILHSFNGGSPGFLAGLVLDQSGALYGTVGGGTDGFGIVYKLAPPATPSGGWAFSVLYNFLGQDGAGPQGNLIFDDAGALYGTTYSGGVNNLGVVYELAPLHGMSAVWTETVLHSFAGEPTDGSSPAAGLVFDKKNRVLYGTTSAGGVSPPAPSAPVGTVFMLSPSGSKRWTETILHTFLGIDGSYEGKDPDAPLVLDSSGALYGEAAITNVHETPGTVFRVAPPAKWTSDWTATDIGVPQPFGEAPAGPFGGLVFDQSGSLYGVTPGFGTSGCPGCPESIVGGGIFKLTPAEGGSWIGQELYAFPITAGTTDGGSPSGPLIIDNAGAFYGMTFGGGTNGFGTVFKLTQ